MQERQPLGSGLQRAHYLPLAFGPWVLVLSAILPKGKACGSMHFKSRAVNDYDDTGATVLSGNDARAATVSDWIGSLLGLP